VIFLVKHTRDTAFIAGVVYFMQGALGISGIALPLYLRGLQWSISEITTVTAIAAFPWVFKILYGLLSDTMPLFGYRRKSYLFLAAGISALGWLLLSGVRPEKHWIIAAMSLSNLGFAAIDVITDGLLVEHSTKFTSSIYQAIAWGSRSVGSVASGIFSGWLAANWKAQYVFLLTMCLPLTICCCVLLIRERKFERSPFSSAVAPVRQCLRLLLEPHMRHFIVILFVVSISASFAIPLFFYMKETLAFPETLLGILSSLGWGGAMLGSVIYAKWLRRVPPKVTLRWAMVLNSINIFSSLLINDQRSALIIVFIGGAMGCLVMLPIVSSAAALTHQSGVEGTLFAVLMSIFNVGQIVFGYIGGNLSAKIGLYPLIITAGVMALVGLFFVEKLQLVEPASDGS
jgi:MFS family permease